MIAADNCNLPKIRQSSSLVLVQDNQRGDDAWHPAAKCEQKHDEHRPAAAVDHRQRREDNGQDDLGRQDMVTVNY